MKLSIHINKREDGCYEACCPALPGCKTTGRNLEQARRRLDEAIRGYMAAMNNFVPERVEEYLVEA